MTSPAPDLSGLLTASASRLGGGVFEAVVTHAAMIRELGGEAPVFALADAHSEEDALRFAPGSVACLPVRGPAQVGFAPRLIETLLAADLDALHLHGIWMYPSRAGTAWARRTGKAYLVSPHGMLDPWITGRGKWKKALARIGYERASWRRASALHALTTAEAADIRAESGRGDAVIIPNAGPAPLAMPESGRAPEFLYLGRIHPKKNIAALVEAWRRLAATGALGEGRLTIAGWGAPEDVAALEADLAQAPPSIVFVGPAYGEAKAALLARSRFFVLPSLSEGLPMAVLEAWASATPAIMTCQCNLPEGFAAGAAIECGFDADAIAQSISTALALPEAQWLRMAGEARALAAGPFSAQAVASRWAGAYRAVMARAAE